MEIKPAKRHQGLISLSGYMSIIGHYAGERILSASMILTILLFQQNRPIFGQDEYHAISPYSRARHCTPASAYARRRHYLRHLPIYALMLMAAWRHEINY